MAFDQVWAGRVRDYIAMRTLKQCLVFLCVCGLLAPGYLQADEIKIACASNFRPVMQQLAKRFESATGHQVTLIFGSSGKQYAQIKNGAPFDVFFSADSERALQLEEDGLAVAGSRFTYAIGRLALWSPQPDYVDPIGDVLKTGTFQHLAIANPDLAPYGKAAQQTLQGLGLWESLQARLVMGENIAQAFQFVSSGSAQLGFVASAQVRNARKRKAAGSFWLVPENLHEPIEQQAVMLKDSAPASAFMQYTRTDAARKLIEGFGYLAP